MSVSTTTVKLEPVISRPNFGPALSQLLQDCPRSEVWRWETDAVEHLFGPDAYRPEYYAGFILALPILDQLLTRGKRITAHDADTLHRAIMEYETTVPLGIREKEPTSFEIKYPNKRYPNTGDISEEGLERFVDCVIEASRIQVKATDAADREDCIWHLYFNSPKSKYQIGPHKTDLEQFLNIDDRKFQTDEKKIDKNEIIKFLKLKFETGRRELEAGQVGQCQIFVTHTATYRTELEAILNNLLKEFYEKMDKIKKNSPTKEDEQLEAIIDFLSKFRMYHFFKDGNGRVFWLLKQLLLYQYMNTFAFDMTPVHFVGYSMDQLKKEMREGIRLFNEFNVKEAKVFLSTYQNDRDLMDPSQFKRELSARLSSNPMIAMAQINEIFLWQMENKPRKFKVGDLSLFSKRQLISTKRQRYRIAQGLLKEMYYENMRKLIDVAKGPKIEKKTDPREDLIPTTYGQVASMEAAVKIFGRHQIIFDDHYQCDALKMKSLYPHVFEMLKEYPFEVTSVTKEETERMMRDFGPGRRRSSS